MKKISKVILALMLVLSFSFTFISCSEKSQPEEQPEVNPNDGEGSTNDFYQKWMEICKNNHSGPQVITTVNTLSILVSGVTEYLKSEGPISVAAARFNGEEVTFIGLTGADALKGQASTMKESQLATFGKPNGFLSGLRTLFMNGTISPDKPVVLAGISLGGMIAQQLLSQDDIMEKFDIRQIITYASPLNVPLDRKGVPVVRFFSTTDFITETEESSLRSGKVTKDQMTQEELEQKIAELDKAEKIVRTSSFDNIIEAHVFSYMIDSCWDTMDFMGDPEKKNVLELLEPLQFYKAPKID